MLLLWVRFGLVIRSDLMHLFLLLTDLNHMELILEEPHLLLLDSFIEITVYFFFLVINQETKQNKRLKTNKSVSIKGLK